MGINMTWFDVLKWFYAISAPLIMWGGSTYGLFIQTDKDIEELLLCIFCGFLITTGFLGLIWFGHTYVFVS